MTEIKRLCDHIMVVSDYENPKPHKHLLSHIVLCGSEMEWNVAGERVKCRGICVSPDVIHSCNTNGEKTLIFLFTETSNYSCSLSSKYFCEKPYAIIDGETVDRALSAAEKANKEGGLSAVDYAVLKILEVDNKKEHNYDPRVKEILKILDTSLCYEKNEVAEIAKKVFLSQSRMSHLFREQTGMTLHSCIAFEKLRKTFFYLESGTNITDSCMKAGFNSPSHFSAACSRMLGISVSAINKTLASK